MIKSGESYVGLNGSTRTVLNIFFFGNKKMVTYENQNNEISTCTYNAFEQWLNFQMQNGNHLEVLNISENAATQMAAQIFNEMEHLFLHVDEDVIKDKIKIVIQEFATCEKKIKLEAM